MTAENKSIKRLINLPNIVSATRILLVLPMIYTMRDFNFTNKIILIGVFIIAILTDYLDGLIARKYEKITKFGELWDSICDKIFGVAFIILSIIYLGLPLWILIAIVAREVLLVTGNIIISKGFPLTIIPSIIIGKVYANLLAYSFIVFILEFELLFSILIIISVVIGYISLPFYYINIYREAN